MSNIEIIKQLQEKVKEIDISTLIAYIKDLIKIEYLRYNNDEFYFNYNFENILLGNNLPSNKLDYAIDQAIFIILQPLRTDIDIKKIERELLSWNGYVLSRDINGGRYPKGILHYFEDDEEFDFMNMSKDEIKARIEYNNMVPCDKKEQCTKVLCKKISKILSKQIKMNDEKYYTNLSIINYRFLRIHPFEDGNGRISRMLINYMINWRNESVPLALNNDEINELINIYKETSKFIYTAFMGGYLSELEYDDDFSFSLEVEEMLIGQISRFIYDKEAEAKNRLKSIQKMSSRKL
jgi:hypothetical protein